MWGFFQKCGDFEEFLSGDFVAIFDYRSGDFEPKWPGNTELRADLYNMWKISQM